MRGRAPHALGIDPPQLSHCTLTPPSSAGWGSPAREVVPVDIVDESVAIVVDAVSGDLLGVDPQIGGEVGVGEVSAGVDDGHNDAGGAWSGLERVKLARLRGRERECVVQVERQGDRLCGPGYEAGRKHRR